MSRTAPAVALSVVLVAAGMAASGGQDQVVRASLTYAAPGAGPKPNFSPKGTQVTLKDIAAGASLPEGAVRPAREGVMEVGPDKAAWVRVLATAEFSHPRDLCRLYVDLNRNGDFSDDGPALVATPTQNEKTKAWWSSFDALELKIPYGAGARAAVEPYSVNFWIVRDDGGDVPDVVRYSVRSWRTGRVTVNGVDALVAMMDSNNDAVFDKSDMWSVLSAAGPDAAKQVLSINEARTTNRFMFIDNGVGKKETVLEFRGASPDGRSVEFAVVDRPITKAADRAPDDMLREERGRPRAQVPFTWNHANFEATLAQARSAGKKVIVDFETTWCGPCKSMDEWVWTDAEVAGALNAGFVGVKLDGDIEKDLVKRFGVRGYPTGIILDPAGKELRRFEGYMGSKDMMALINR